LHEVGAARSIVIDENGVVLAGNATVDAAGQVGITRVRVVDADGETLIAVRRTGLTDKQKRRLALFDNRSAELSSWDADAIMAQVGGAEALLEGLFLPQELNDLAAAVATGDNALDAEFLEEAEGQRIGLKDNAVTCPSCGHSFTPEKK
jgi:hypothetical protein